jgi:hypothetical protein
MARTPNMYKNNSRDSSKYEDCSPLQNCIGLINLSPQSTTLHILNVKGK